MEKVKQVVAIACLVFLAACECGKDKSCCSANTGINVTEDCVLRGSAADFIANAGDRVFFGFDKSGVSLEAESILSRQADWLKANSDRSVLIEGHCDEKGTREYNIGLGDRRATSVADFLKNNGVNSEKIRVISYGKDRPIVAQGSNEEINQMNRVAIAVVE